MTSTRYSISAASRIVDKSRATISRHLAAGKLSFDLDPEGNKAIEASELLRVYGDACDFEREEKRGRPSETKRVESQPAESGAAVEAMREQLVKQYVAQVEHLQQALEKAQDGQNRVTLLLEQRSSERNDWRQAIDAMSKSIANQTDAQLKRLKESHDKELAQLKRALHRERNKGLWSRLFGGQGR